MLPTQLGYRMPAEWGPHERTFMAWPVRQSMIYPEDYIEVCNGYLEIIHAISEFEPVTVIVNPDDRQQAAEMLDGSHSIQLWEIPHNDAWLRDNGPTFLLGKTGERAAVKWGFNAWGEKYEPWDLDDEVAGLLLEKLGVQRFDAPMIMEGGSIHVDGEGTLLTTEECLLNPNRNPDLNRQQIEKILHSYVGIKKVIWLKRGLHGDETDGHVDNMACFAAPGKIIMQMCDDPSDENAEITRENLEVLRQTVDAAGRQLEIVPIAQPPKRMHQGKRLTLSYLNFYFVKGGIILPVFGGDAAETDQQAVQTLQKHFPERKIRTVNGLAIIIEGGNVHCTTQQLPTKGGALR